MPRETQLTILIGVFATLVGYFIPEYYDWTGADQSRAAPIVGVHAALLAAMTAIALGGIYAWDRRSKIDADQERTSDPHLQVSIRQIVILTALVACFTAGITGVGAMGEEYQRIGAGLLSASAAFATLLAVLVAILKPLLRLQILGMLACQFGPFFWVCRTIGGSGNGAANFVMGVPVLPALIPAHIYVELHFEFAIGAACNCRDHRRRPNRSWLVADTKRSQTRVGLFNRARQLLDCGFVHRQRADANVTLSSCVEPRCR